MPPTPAARGEAGDQRDHDRRFLVHAGKDVEGDGEKRVAGEDGGRLVERTVHGRPAAAEVVIVHRRQVVVDEAVAVDAFERRGGGDDRLAAPAEQPRRLDQEERAETLAAAEHGVAHRGDEPLRPFRLVARRVGREEAVERRLGRRRGIGQAFLELIVHAPSNGAKALPRSSVLASPWPFDQDCRRRNRQQRPASDASAPRVSWYLSADMTSAAEIKPDMARPTASGRPPSVGGCGEVCGRWRRSSPCR